MYSLNIHVYINDNPNLSFQIAVTTLFNVLCTRNNLEIYEKNMVTAVWVRLMDLPLQESFTENNNISEEQQVKFPDVTEARK